MTTSAQISAHSIARPTLAGGPAAHPRPDLPSWFGGATALLLTASGGEAVLLAGLALITALAPTPNGLAVLGAFAFATSQAATGFAMGLWCHTIAQSRRVDPTTPQLNPMWFLAAWFIPIVNVFVPHQMFGDLWASAKWQQSDRRGRNTPLAPRPWIISFWAFAWGLELAWVTITWFFLDLTAAVLVAHLGLSAAVLGLLAGVVRTIARELGDPTPTTSR